MRLVCCFIAPAVLLAAGVSRAADEPEVSAKLKEKLGEPTLAILKNAVRVEAFRIKPIRPDKPDEKSIAGYTIRSTGKELKKEFAGKLAAVLLLDKTYFGEQERCFLPGIAFRLWTDKKESVDVMIAIGCSNLRIVSRDAEGKEIKSVSGGFGPDIVPLLKLAKEAFPDDKDIQEIAEEKK